MRDLEIDGRIIEQNLRKEVFAQWLAFLIITLCVLIPKGEKWSIDEQPYEVSCKINNCILKGDLDGTK